MKSLLFLIFVLLTYGHILSAPSENSYVVFSTEPPKKGSADDRNSIFPEIYAMDIKANISNRFAKALITSRVRNFGISAKETTFTVVLPERAFISGFVMEIDGKSYKAYVKEKEEAQNIYNKAVSTGQSAGHVAVSARDSNRFTMSVNLEPESKAVFMLTYEELLQRKYEQYELVLNINPGQIVKNMNVEVFINESRPLKFVKTPPLRTGNEISRNEDKLHPSTDIKIINSSSAVVKFHPDIVEQKQFARYLGTQESSGLSGQFVVQYDVSRDPQCGEVLLQDGYFVHFFAPDDLDPLPKYVVFVLDTSESMSGTKIDQLKTAMASILSEIRTGDMLNIIEFNTNVNVLDINHEKSVLITHNNRDNYLEPYTELKRYELPSPSTANEANIGLAKSLITEIRAEGATNIIGGLETALYLIKLEKEKNINNTNKYQPILIFLTDGNPNFGMSSTGKIINTVTKLNKEHKVPIYSLSFGNGANKEFLRKLSLNNLGFSRHIYEASDASLQLEEFYKQISSPLLSDVNFTYDSPVKELTKSHFPVYFKGSELIVAGKFEGPSLRGPVRSWAYPRPVPFTTNVEKPVSSLERLWAYLTIKQIFDERDRTDNKTELMKKALDLALKYSFVTDVSSLVVVKPNDTTAVNTEEASEKPRPSGPGYPRPSWAPYSQSSHNSFVRPISSILHSPREPQLHYSRPPFPPSSPHLYNTSRFQHLYNISRFPTRSPLRFSPQISTRVPPPLRPGTTPPTVYIPKPPLLDALPWIREFLNPDRTLSILQRNYRLGANAFVTSSEPCPKTPINGTDTGVCTLLRDCPQVYSYLTDFPTYQKYFCPLNNKFAGVCCPKVVIS